MSQKVCPACNATIEGHQACWNCGADCVDPDTGESIAKTVRAPSTKKKGTLKKKKK